MGQFKKSNKPSFGRRDSSRSKDRFSEHRSERSDRGFSDRGSRSFDRRDSGRSRQGERPEMHEVVCDKCGRRCEVPFRPRGDKPVYCSDCFRKNEPSEPRGGKDASSSSSKEFAEINEKLDKIMDVLGID